MGESHTHQVGERERGRERERGIGCFEEYVDISG